MARPSELDAENRSGKTVSTAATAYFRTGYPTDVGGGEFEYVAEVSGLGGVDFLAEGWEEREQVQAPSALVPHWGVHLFGLGFYGSFRLPDEPILVHPIFQIARSP